MVSMGWVAFLIAVLYVCLGFAAGTLLSRRGIIGPAAAAPPPRPKDEEEDSFKISGEQAAEFIASIQKLATNVDSGVDRHNTRVAEISRGLADEDRNTVSAAAAAAAQLLEANQQLQQDLAAAKKELEVQKQQLDSYIAESLTDPLTGLGNRRRFDQELSRRFAQWARVGTPLSVLLVDIDHFKQVNDSHGHPAGDAVLHDVAQVLTECVREMDVVARYGGEEFGLILPDTALPQGSVVAERIRGTIAARKFRHGDLALGITVSAGLAQAHPDDDKEVLMARTDAAVYSAKESGRNCCHLHDGESFLPIEKSYGRKKSEKSQRIAPFVDGKFPDADMFYSVDCEELSPQGFTFLAPEKPAYDKVLWARDEQNRAYASASVHDCQNIGTEATPLYRVSCRFTVPVDQLAEATAV